MSKNITSVFIFVYLSILKLYSYIFSEYNYWQVIFYGFIVTFMELKLLEIILKICTYNNIKFFIFL